MRKNMINHESNGYKIIVVDDGNDDNKINCLIITTNYSSAIEVEGCYNVSLCDKLIFRKSIDDQVIYACNTVDGEIIIITKTSILYYNEYLELKIAKTFSNISPLLVKYHKKTNSIYVYFNNRTLQKLTINNNEIDYECILSNVEISAFDISNYFIVYSTWDSNTINLYSFSTKNIQCLCTVDDDFDVHTSSIQIIKKDGNKFIFISLSNGKMLYFKLKQQFRTLNSYTFSRGIVNGSDDTYIFSSNMPEDISDGDRIEFLGKLWSVTSVGVYFDQGRFVNAGIMDSDKLMAKCPKGITLK